MLLFAQLLREMLEIGSFESFRAYSLDTLKRLEEAVALAADIERGRRIDPAALIPIVQEISWTLDKDPVARVRVAPQASLLSSLTAGDKYPLDRLVHSLRQIHRLLDTGYKGALEALILSTFDDNGKRSDLRKLAGFYCSHLINIGYSRQYVLDRVLHKFFSRALSRIGRRTLGDFFGYFDGKSHKYIVTCGVADDLGNYLRELGATVRATVACDPEAAHAISLNGNSAALKSALEKTTEQLDPYRAMDAVEQELSSQRAISFLNPRGMHAEWGSVMHVKRARANGGDAIERDTLLRTRPTEPVNAPASRVRNIRSYASAIDANFDPPSTERLISSINTAALARTSTNPENQLISLWSAFEVLLSDPRESARIVHYANLIVPVICIRHVRRKFISVHNALIVAYRKKFTDIMKRVPDVSQTGMGLDLAQLICIPANKPLQDDLLKVCSDNPLMLHRLYKLHREYSQIARIKETISEHETRVRWQIHRVYRARNQLVHAGHRPSYLDSLIINVAEYYRASVSTIISSAMKDASRSDIDQAVAEVCIHYQILKRGFAARNDGLPPEIADVRRLLAIVD